MYFEIDNFNALRAALHSMCDAFSRLHIPDETVFDSKLVASELLSNVLQHGGEKAYFRVATGEDSITMCVRGDVTYRPPKKSTLANVEAECGRGMYLVDQYCEKRVYSEQEGIRVVIRFAKQ